MKIPTIEKAILADVCLGVPLGKIVFDIPAHWDMPDAVRIKPPDTFLFRGDQLALMKSLNRSGDGLVAEAVRELIASAEQARKSGPFSVTHKNKFRFSKDPHDYQSLAKYSWPDARSKNGLPHVIMDGAINPDCYSDDFDYLRINEFTDHVLVLALSSYLSDNKVHARKAASLLKAWFVNPATRQNPHFSYSQVSPGNTKLRWQGIIEARPLIYVSEAVRLLESVNLLPADLAAKIRIWYEALLRWLCDSEQGRAAQQAKNNIGFWYDAQRMVYAHFCGKTTLVDDIIFSSILPRLNDAVHDDGSLPLEMVRAHPTDYVAFSLVAMALIGRGGEHTGLNLWGTQESDGRNFQVAHDWLLHASAAGKFLSTVKPKDGDHSPAAWDNMGQILNTGIKLRLLQRVVDIQNNHLSNLRIEQTGICSELEDIRKKNSQLESRAKHQEERHAQLQAKHDELKLDSRKIKDNFIRIEALHQEAISRILELKEESKNSRNATRVTEKDLTNALVKLGISDHTLETLKKQNARLADQMRSLEEKTSEIDQKNKALEAASLTWELKKDFLEKSNLDLQKNASRLCANNEALAENVGKLKTEHAEAQKQIAQLRQHNQELAENADALKTEHAEAQKQIAQLRKKKDDLVKKADALGAENADCHKKIGHLESLHEKLLAKQIKLEGAILNYKDRHRRMLSSYSWRLSLPLRLAFRGVKLIAGVTSPPVRRNAPLPEVTVGEDVPIQDQPTKLSPIENEKPAVSNPKTAPVNRKVALARSTPLDTLLAAKPHHENALKKAYEESALRDQPDTFVLYRIIGNDLVPRHKKGQSRENVQFILDHEPPLPQCEKRWIINRIVDPDEERQIISLLESRKQSYLRIAFEREEYRQIGWDWGALPKPDFLYAEAFDSLGPEQQDRLRTALYRLKNNYLMNNNGARNVALQDGLARAKWVLPWDGNCFVTSSAWEQITADVTSRPHLKYFAVPMERMMDNELLLRDDLKPDPVEEPQLIFRCDSTESFREAQPYGRRPKVELFWRLGIPGPWDRWKDDPWDLPRARKSPDAGAFGVAGWVARMFSGVKELETEDKVAFKNRGLARQEAIVAAIDYIDRHVQLMSTRRDGIAIYTLPETGQDPVPIPQKLHHVAEQIVSNAERTLAGGVYSVTQKTTLPPSGDLHDYWHPAPYWWPNPHTKDGLPYIRKDGQRVPGTRMYEPDSDQYDRTRLQLMFDGSACLALAWKLTGRQEFAEKGADIIRAWFINPNTRMNPHLRYAQVRMGHNKNEGLSTGIIEFKDFYYFLDAVRILSESGSFREEDTRIFKEWLCSYAEWLRTSPQGRKEMYSRNNHGTYYDLQMAAIFHYLGDQDRLRETFLRAASRIPKQFTENGEQPEEMTRSLTQHYCFFNLQGWLNILLLARAAGITLGEPESEPLVRITSSCHWVLGHDMTQWPYEQIEPFDIERALPLALSATRLGIAADRIRPEYSMEAIMAAKPVFDPHDAIQPYWNLTMHAETIHP
jgi:low affinity Fe/Cu permease